MKLFERDFKAAATAEFERSVRDLEERNKVAQTKPTSDFQVCTEGIQSNLNFAERLNLITAIQVETYRQRIEKAQHEFGLMIQRNAEAERRRIFSGGSSFENTQRTETRDDIVDGFENPRERAARYQDMESYNAQIAQEKAKASDKEVGTEQTRTHEIHAEPEEHTR